MSVQIRPAPGVAIREVEAAIEHHALVTLDQRRKLARLDQRAHGVILPAHPCASRMAAPRAHSQIEFRIPVGSYSAVEVIVRRAIVCLKRVVDYNVRIRVEADGSGVAIEGAKTSINPFDEIALEEALRLREHAKLDEVVVVSVGGASWQQQLRTGLAMGADRAVLVETTSSLSPLTVARALHALVRREQPVLVLLGKQAIDDDNNQMGQMLAAIWDRPQATFASELVCTAEKATVTREVDAGLEVIEIDLPAVVTADLRLNEPRYVKLPEIMKAKKKPLEVVAFESLGVPAQNGFLVVHTAAPPARQAGTRVESVSELLGALKSRGLLA
jgi:electron transfer flavoprotein beta subunit